MEPLDARLIKVYVRDWDQPENQRAPPGLTETYLVRLKQDSDFCELYQLPYYPRQMIIRKDGTIHYLGNRLDDEILYHIVEHLSLQPFTQCDEIKNFKLVRSSVDHSQKNQLMLFIKKLEQCYSDILALPISWKIEFTERTSYTVKGDAKRSFVCEISLITSSAMRESEDLKMMVQSIERLCFGWLNFRVVWTVIKDYPLLQ